jgi:protein ImuA
MVGDPLSALRARVRQIERPAAWAHGVVPFGLSAIDRVLPGGGLARGAVHEILGAGGDEEDGALAAGFAAAILARLGDGSGPVLWCLPRPDLYGPGLAALGLDPDRLVLLAARADADLLWAMEEGLRTPGLAAVVGEIGAFAAVASRRLQLAAERSGVTGLVLRRWREAAEAARERGLANAATTRWRVAALPSAPTLPSPAAGGGLGRGWVGAARWRVELLRCRGGEPAAWEVEVADATGALSVAAAMADRPSAARRGEWRRAG